MIFPSSFLLSVHYKIEALTWIVFLQTKLRYIVSLIFIKLREKTLKSWESGK